VATRELRSRDRTSRGASDDDLVLRPINLLVPEAQPLTLPAAGLDRPDDSVVRRGSNPLVLGRVHRDARGKELRVGAPRRIQSSTSFG
jgi:hypothetical protein